MESKTTTALKVFDPKKISPETQKKFDDLLKIKKLGQEDIAALTDQETIQFGLYLTIALSEKKGEELDFLLEQCEGINTAEFRLDIKQKNYVNITYVIAAFVKEYGRMPTKIEVAERTGLSRKTVHKHLKEYRGSNHLDAQVQQYRLMTSNVMDKVLRSAVNGDMKAARLFLDTVGKLSKLTAASSGTIINQQNNYVQINGMVLNQQILQQLKPEQLKQIEEMVKGVGK